MFLVLLLILIILSVYLLKRHSKIFSYVTWFIVVYWIINIIISISVFRKFDWKFTGFVWIMLACITFVLVYNYTYAKIVDTPHETKTIPDENNKISNIFLAIVIGLALIYINILVNGFGYKITALFNLNELIELNKTASNIRYNDDTVFPLYKQIFLIFPYAAVLIGGYSKPYAKTKTANILSFLSLLPILLILLIENTKASLISGVLLWICGWVVGRLELHKKLPSINKKKVLLVLAGGFVFLCLLLLSMTLRIGTFDIATFKIVFDKFINYAFGHMAAFDYWFRNNFNNIDLSFGKYTFFGIFNFLGIANRATGVYSEFLESGSISTNVYTANRGIIMDFGLIGGLVIYGLLGFISAYAYKRIIRSDRRHEISVTILTAVLAFIGFSFIISFFTYLSYTIAFGVFFVYLMTKNRGKQIFLRLKKKEDKIDSKA